MDEAEKDTQSPDAQYIPQTHDSNETTSQVTPFLPSVTTQLIPSRN